MANEKLDKSLVGEDFISGLFAAIEMPTGTVPRRLYFPALQ
jgi:hypothetical protein